MPALVSTFGERLLGGRAPESTRVRVRELTVLGGTDKDGRPEPVRRLTLRPGDVVTIVEPTGSGKSAPLRDVEPLAQATRSRSAGR